MEWWKTSNLDERALITLVFDDLLRFDVVGHLTFLVSAPHKETSAGPVAAPPRYQRVGKNVPTDAAVLRLHNCQQGISSHYMKFRYPKRVQVLGPGQLTSVHYG